MAAKRSEADPETLHETVEEESRPQRVSDFRRRRKKRTNCTGRCARSASATMLLAVLAMLTVCYFAKLPIIVLLISILLAFILAPLADLFQRIRLPRSLAALIAMLLFLTVLYGIGQVSYNKAVVVQRRPAEIFREDPVGTGQGAQAGAGVPEDHVVGVAGRGKAGEPTPQGSRCSRRKTGPNT